MALHFLVSSIQMTVENPGMLKEAVNDNAVDGQKIHSSTMNNRRAQNAESTVRPNQMEMLNFMRGLTEIFQVASKDGEWLGRRRMIVDRTWKWDGPLGTCRRKWWVNLAQNTIHQKESCHTPLQELGNGEYGICMNILKMGQMPINLSFVGSNWDFLL